MKLTKVAFKAWLKGKKPTARIGKPKDCCWCPIATYLDSASGNRVHIVTQDAYTDATAIEQPLPYWARQFIIKVDRVRSTYVTAAKALSLLE